MLKDISLDGNVPEQHTSDDFMNGKEGNTMMVNGQVISISGGDSAYKSLYTTSPALKDTVIVPRMGSVKLLVPVMDFTGMTMFHCPILEHEDMGMMGVWDIQ